MSNRAGRSPVDLTHLTPAQRVEVAALVSELERRRERHRLQNEFLPFVRAMWPIFIGGYHHRRMAEAFERVARGELTRLVINMPPRHTKSEFGSWLLPAWFIGRNPSEKIIQISGTTSLAEKFGRQVRNTVASQEYASVFPGVSLMQDSRAAGRWDTNHGGSYFAAGVGTSITGRGATLCLIDDPHDEQEAVLGRFNPALYEKVYEYYKSGPRQRLQPGARIVLIQTRWAENDLTGMLLEKAVSDPEADQWEVISFPAILPEDPEIGMPEVPIWPEYWDIETLQRTRASIDKWRWEAQYQQNPTAEGAAVIKREDWRMWSHSRPPAVEFKIMTFDTAHEEKSSADYSACTVWGVWTDDDGTPQIILLNTWRDKVEFPKLKREAKRLWLEWEPDMTIVEKKASGAPLISELRMQGLPIQEYTPSRGNSKLARLNAVADLFASGYVWAPDRPWAHTLIEEVAAFPAGRNDDLTDCTSLALMYFRRGGFVSTKNDQADSELDKYRLAGRRAAYY